MKKDKGWIYILLAILLSILCYITIGCKRPVPADAKLVGAYQLKMARVVPNGWELNLGDKIVIRTFSGIYDVQPPRAYELDVWYDVYEKGGNYYVQKSTRKVTK